MHLQQLLTAFDKKGAGELCSKFIAALYNSDEPFSQKHAEKIMQLLRNKRMFHWMQKTGDALIQTGRHTLKIRRLYAQALSDLACLTAAVAVLNNLVSD
ncbi:MAG: hypothetical protein WKF89_09370 [Chitinophagaceae bacterium]